jgi:hypothetical protein
MTWNAVQSCTCIYGITVKSFASLHFISLRQTIISSRIGHITRWLGVVLHKHAATRSIPGLWFILVGSRCVKGPIHGQTNLRNSMLYNKRLSIHDTISLRKLQSLGKSHNENVQSCLFGNFSCLRDEGRDRIPEEDKEYFDKDWLKRSV